MIIIIIIIIINNNNNNNNINHRLINENAVKKEDFMV